MNISEPKGDLFYEFVYTFARYEYALKRAGYVRIARPDAQADWQTFAMTVSAEFDLLPRDGGLGEAIKYFLSNPPKKQIQKDKKLEWGTVPPYESGTRLFAWLCPCVSRVRNNLFHGGKFPSGPIDEPSRDENLLRHSIVMLKAALPIDSEVQRYFREHV